MKFAKQYILRVYMLSPEVGYRGTKQMRSLFSSICVGGGQTINSKQI